jgi:hypothetical protein
MARISRHLRSNAVAFLALFVALGGSSYAAFKVDGGDVKNGSLTGVDIKNGSLLGIDLHQHTIGKSKLAADALVPGPKGDPGQQGPPGSKGDTGSVDTSGFYGKAQSDARFALLISQDVSITFTMVVPPGATQNSQEIQCPDRTAPGRGRYKLGSGNSAIPPGSVTGETVSSTGYHITVTNTSGANYNGGVELALSCVRIDAPVPALP